MVFFCWAPAKNIDLYQVFSLGVGLLTAQGIVDLIQCRNDWRAWSKPYGRYFPARIFPIVVEAKAMQCLFAFKTLKITIWSAYHA